MKKNKVKSKKKDLPKGVMLNAYPDSIGETLAEYVFRMDPTGLTGIPFIRR